MKRAIVAAVLAGFVLGSAPTQADPVSWLVDSLKPPKRVLIQGWYRRIGTTNRYVILCEASAFGGYAVLTRITACNVTGSNGGFARGVTPVVYPGLEAMTVGEGGFDPGVFTACITANARYADGTIVSSSGCEPAKKLEQGYI